MTDASLPQLVSRLRAAGCVYAEEEAALLVAEAATRAQLEELIVRRIDGLPLEQVLGWAAFCGLRIVVRPGVFVPRRRSEFLAHQAIARTRATSVVVDLCCGTGALGAAVRAARPGIELYAADIDPAEVECARRNLGDCVYEGDLFAALPAELQGRIDVLVVNAPYVPTDNVALMPPEARLHEAPVALDGGPDGLDIQRRVIAGAPSWLAPGGAVLIETSVRQAPVSVDLLARTGLSTQLMRDENLDATVVIGTA
ncbi:MAG: putative protein N(5)-glutamine methyltransferase [Marmoricola sp.]|nr:putative protein N(5)-glutamine methyltransferase [Marmoricola sp.]